MVPVASWLASGFLALNIGASGTAAAMGAAYGGKALSRRAAMCLAGIMALMGAVLAGEAVVRTIGGGIIALDQLSASAPLLVLAAAGTSLAVANGLGVPLSTSEVTVGALVGLGLAVGDLNTRRLGVILFSWALLPLVACLLAYLLRRYTYDGVIRWLGSLGEVERVQRVLAAVLIMAGCLEAFAAGSNNVANAVGPLVGTGLLAASPATLWGGLGLAVGAMLFGGKVLETNGRCITDLCLITGATVSLVSGSLVLLASLLGMPVPLTQATTASIIGIGLAAEGRQALHREVVGKILRTWIFSPLISMLLSYTLAGIFFKS